MADAADLASIQNEIAEAALLQVRKPAGPKSAGHCLYCKGQLAPGLRWCDKNCEEDWEVEEAAAKRNGGRRG